MLVLGLGVNALTALLTFFSLIGYSIVYTVYLSTRRRRTSSSAAPPGAAAAGARVGRESAAK